MRTKLAAVLLAGALTPLPPAPFATTSRQPGVSLGMGQAAATHATRGVVKSIDGTMLVIIRFARRGELTFSLLPSTKREGAIVVGSTVSVRYREDGKSHIATAVALQRSRE